MPHYAFWAKSAACAANTGRVYYLCWARQYLYSSGYSHDQQLWYAFWQEMADSSHATLIVGIEPGNIDTFSLGRDTSHIWHYTESDTIVPYSRVYVYVTSDSVIEGSFGVDAGTYYYLKKLN